MFKRTLDNITDGITTSQLDDEIACQSLQMVLMNFGFLVFGVTDYAGQTMTAHYGAVAAREPRDDDVKASCRLLGRRLAEWVD